MYEMVLLTGDPDEDTEILNEMAVDEWVLMQVVARPGNPWAWFVGSDLYAVFRKSDQRSFETS